MCPCFGLGLANNHFADTADDDDFDDNHSCGDDDDRETFCLGWGVTDYGDTAEDFPEKLLEVEVGLYLN